MATNDVCVRLTTIEDEEGLRQEIEIGLLTGRRITSRGMRETIPSYWVGKRGMTRAVR